MVKIHVLATEPEIAASPDYGLLAMTVFCYSVLVAVSLSPLIWPSSLAA